MPVLRYRTEMSLPDRSPGLENTNSLRSAPASSTGNTITAPAITRTAAAAGQANRRVGKTRRSGSAVGSITWVPSAAARKIRDLSCAGGLGASSRPSRIQSRAAITVRRHLGQSARC